MYCPKCKHIVDEAKCPFCKKPTREPNSDDICFLTEKHKPLIGMLSDVLEQNGIHSLQMSELGAGMSAIISWNVEYTRLYTTYADRDRALELMDELFNAPPLEADQSDESAPEDAKE